MVEQHRASLGMSCATPGAEVQDAQAVSCAPLYVNVPAGDSSAAEVVTVRLERDARGEPQDSRWPIPECDTPLVLHASAVWGG